MQRDLQPVYKKDHKLFSERRVGSTEEVSAEIQ